jgi:hypothetical protein
MKRPNDEFNAGGRAASASFRAYLKRLAAKPGVSVATIDTIITWLGERAKRNADKGGFGRK